jgi:hypothetical protein
MLRRFTTKSVVTPQQQQKALVTISQNANLINSSRRGVCDCLGPILGHLASISQISATNMMFTPVGTAFLAVLAFNVNYVGLKHLWYTTEMPLRDYVQDAAVKQALRYLILLSLMFAGNGIFCSV